MDDSSPNGRYPWRLAAFTALAIAAGGTGCTGFKGTTATSFLRNVRQDPDPNVRYASYEKLGSLNCYDNAEQRAEAVKTLIGKLEEGREPVATRAVICRTLGSLGDKSAREPLIRAVSDPEPVVRVQACRALGKVGAAEDATLLARVMTVDTLEDCRIAAIEGIGAMKARDPRIMEVLVTGMDHDDPAIRLSSLKALRQITGKDLGVETEPWRKMVVAEYKAAGSATQVARTDNAAESRPGVAQPPALVSADATPTATPTAPPTLATSPVAAPASAPVTAPLASIPSVPTTVPAPMPAEAQPAVQGLSGYPVAAAPAAPSSAPATVPLASIPSLPTTVLAPMPAESPLAPNALAGYQSSSAAPANPAQPPPGASQPVPVSQPAMVPQPALASQPPPVSQPAPAMATQPATRPSVFTLFRSRGASPATANANAGQAGSAAAKPSPLNEVAAPFDPAASATSHEVVMPK